MKRVTIATWMALGLLPWLIGCGDSKKTTYKASGVILYDNGQPVKNVTLAFVPVGGFVEGEMLPQATTDENGKFEISTYGEKDGAPAGEYKVTLSASVAMLKPPAPSEKPSAGPMTMPQMKVDAPQDYLMKDKTPLRVKITSGDNSGIKLEVKRAAGTGS